MERHWSLLRRICVATAIAGTLDILAAILLTLFYGREPAAMLRYVASGPIPQATTWGNGGAFLGLLVHFAIMTVIAGAYILAADRRPALKAEPILWGVLYGLFSYVVMNLVVVPLRFGVLPSTVAVLSQLFCHIILVGLPIAFVARR